MTLLPRGRWRLAVIIGAVVALLAVALAWLPSQGLRYGLIRSLVDLGWSQVSVDRTRLSLFSGQVEIRRLDAATSAATTDDAAGLAGLDLHMDWRPLFSRRVWLPQLSLDGLRLDLRRDGGGWTISGLPLPTGGGGGDAEGATPWGWGLGALTLTNSRLSITDGAVHMVLDVESLHLSDLTSWDPERPARLDLNARVDNTPMAIAGEIRPFATGGPVVALTLKTQGLPIDTAAAWAGLTQWHGKIDADLAVSASLTAKTQAKVSGKLAVHDAMLPLQGGDLRAGQLDWQGEIDWDGALRLTGKAGLDSFALSQPPIAMGVSQAKLAITEATLNDKATIFDWNGSLQARDWHLAMDTLSVDHQSLSWQGRSRVDLDPQAKALFSATGQAKTENSVVEDGSARLAAHAIEASGELTHTRAHGILPPLEGRLKLAVTNVELRQAGRVWLTSESARIERLDLAGDGVKAPSIRIGGLTALSWPGRYGPRLAAAASTITGVTVSPQGALAATELALDRPMISLSRDGAGLAGLSDLGGDDKPAAKPAHNPTPAAAAAPPPELRLGRMVLTGAGKLAFRDATTSRPVSLDLSNLAATVGEMDSAHPERDTPITASARIGDAKLTLSGRFRPLQPLADGNFKGQIAHLELPPLSPYLADNLGVDLQTGQLDAKIDMGLRSGKLDGRMDLTLNRLTIAPPDPDAPLAKHSDLPIETGLDLLRDSEGRIRLTIPVSGDVGAPDFDFSDAINQAIGGALKSTVLTTLKVAFPLVGLISLAIDDDSSASRMALPALGFAPGDASVTAQNSPALGQLRQMLAEHEQIKLNLCGVASRPVDTQPLLGSGNTAPPAEVTERLRRLAETRSAVAKTWLVDRGIDAGRLFTCHPRIEAEPAKGGPRVELLL